MTVAVSAHQGGSEAAPGGTWEAYEHALAVGADYVELDVRRTLDGELVNFHDARVGKDGPWVRDLTRSELSASAGYEVPGVRELLGLMAGRARGHIDVKEPGYETQTVELAGEALGEDSFVITSGDLVVGTVKRAFPQVRCALALGGGLFTSRLSELYPARRMRACGADSLAVHHRLADLTILRVCARFRINAMVYTVNDPVKMRRYLLDERVTVLVTDRPAHAIALRATAPAREAATPTGGALDAGPSVG
jgi:glycerophosphoryl diester phosphodiesterase